MIPRAPRSIAGALPTMFALALAIALPRADGGRPAAGWFLPLLRGGSDDGHAMPSRNVSHSPEPGNPSNMPSSVGSRELPDELPDAWHKPSGRQGGVGCHEPTCSKVAKYGPRGSSMVSSCAEHKLEGWVDLRNKRCNFPGCPKMPSYGDVKDKRPSVCRDHKEANDVDLRHPTCKHPAGCSRQALFALQQKPSERFCARHKDPKMVLIGTRLCEGGEGSGCSKRPIFGSASDGRRRYCATHRGEGDVDLVHRRCSTPEGCFRIAIWGSAAGKALRCTRHRKEGDVSKQARSCRITGCNETAVFSASGPAPTRLSRCIKHASQGMRKASRTCQFSTCTVQAVHGEKGGAAIFCLDHRDETKHQDVVNALCKIDGCGKRASFGVPKDGVPLFCAKHSDRMVHEDIRHVRCASKGCIKHASFFMPGSSAPRTCKQHKQDGYVGASNRLANSHSCR